MKIHYMKMAVVMMAIMAGKVVEVKDGVPVLSFGETETLLGNVLG